jgi:4-hydroxy-tetrahydrodipicolinate synthase
MMPFATSTSWLTGYIPDIPTPFNEAGAIDLNAFAWLCERQIQAGVSAIVVGETAGEFSTLTSAECDAIVRTAANIAGGRVRVIAGAGSNSTGQAVEQARRAELAGADALLSVVPYYNKPMQTGIEAHFREIANSTALPVVLHDVPARTIRGLADDTLLKLAQTPQFIGLKDSTADLSRLLRLRSMAPEQFRLMSGDDATALAFLAGGGDGCISIVSNIKPSHARPNAVRAEPAPAAFTANDPGCGGESGDGQIRTEPARPDASRHPPASRRTVGSGEGQNCRCDRGDRGKRHHAGRDECFSCHFGPGPRI